jgi:NADH:ubiquinone oxidoreductase subunit 6 (subunit J)
LDNVERVGFDLFRSHPLGLELAGVILLVALVGAVVIARQKIGEETSQNG